MRKRITFPQSNVKKPDGPKQQESVKTPAAEKREYRQHNRIAIAPGFSVTTMPGSLYCTMLKVLAALGHLARHDHLFKTFTKDATVAAAHALFQEIAVARSEMEDYVRADNEFQAHCEKRTQEYRKLAARGNKKYQRILKNPNICDKRGRWIGDLQEGINILSGGRTLVQVRKGKNLRILHRAGLMFDTLPVGSQFFCVLYPQKHHRAFLKAVSLIQRIPA